MQTQLVEKTTEEMNEDGMEFFLQYVPGGHQGTPIHIHEFIEIVYVQEGDFTVYVNQDEYYAQKGDLLLVRSNCSHEISANALPDNAYYILKVKLSLFFELASKKNVMDYALRFMIASDGGKTLWKAEEIESSGTGQVIRKMIQEEKAENWCRDISLKIGAYQVIRFLLQDMIKTEQENGKQASLNCNVAHVYKAIQYINRNYKEEVDARKCAALVNMSYSYFSRSFKKITQKSFRRYLNEVRIRHAQELLATTDLSITQIAFECGYSNATYFIETYKAFMGKTPNTVRKDQRIRQL